MPFATSHSFECKNKTSGHLLMLGAVQTNVADATRTKTYPPSVFRSSRQETANVGRSQARPIAFARRPSIASAGRPTRITTIPPLVRAASSAKSEIPCTHSTGQTPNTSISPTGHSRAELSYLHAARQHLARDHHLERRKDDAGACNQEARDGHLHLPKARQGNADHDGNHSQLTDPKGQTTGRQEESPFSQDSGRDRDTRTQAP